MILFHENDFSDTNKDLFDNCGTRKTSPDNNEYICSQCKRSLQKNELPSLAMFNNLQLKEIPKELKDFNSLEVAFISRRVPFMKLLALPRGTQTCVHNFVVNIPVEPEDSVSILPRVPSSASMVLVWLKRKLQYRGHVFLQNIKPQKILDALNTLQLINPLYSDVKVDENWHQSYSNESPELWDCLSASLKDVSHEN